MEIRSTQEFIEIYIFPCSFESPSRRIVHENETKVCAALSSPLESTNLRKTPIKRSGGFFPLLLCLHIERHSFPLYSTIHSNQTPFLLICLVYSCQTFFFSCLYCTFQTHSYGHTKFPFLPFPHLYHSTLSPSPPFFLFSGIIYSIPVPLPTRNEFDFIDSIRIMRHEK